MIQFYWLVPFSVTLWCVATIIQAAGRRTGESAMLGVLAAAVIPVLVTAITWCVFFFCLWAFGA